MILRRLTIIITFLTAWVWSNGQQINAVPDYVFRNQMSVGRNAVTDTAAYFSIGPRYGANKGFMPPIVVDTAIFSSGKRNGLLIFSVQKNKFLYWDSVRVQWSDMAGSSGSYITGTLTNNYIPKATSSTTLGNSIMYDSSGHIRIYGNYVGNTLENRTLFTSEISGLNGYTALLKQSDSISNAGQFPLILRKGLLTSDKPRPNYGVGMETQLQDDAGTWRRSGFVVNRIVDSTAANFRTKFDFRLINGSTYPIPLIVSGDSSIRMAKLAGSGTRYVVADANGDLSATGSTALVDTLTIATRAWRQKGLDSLAALEVSGSGTTNYIPKFTAGSTIGNSQIFDNGTNVGIGTSSPISGSVLDVTSSTNVYPRIRSTGTGEAFQFYQNSTSGTTAGDGLFVGINSGNDAFFYNSEATPARFFTSATERLRITSGGDVGIGTSSPSEKLDVSGFIRTTSGVKVTDGTIDFRLSWASGNVGFFGNISNHPIDFYTNAAQRMRIFANGRVGINTTTDAGYQLDVNGTLRSVNGANFATTSGNVGIGTASPQRKVVSEIIGANDFNFAATSASLGTIGNWVGYLYGFAGNTYQKGATFFESIDGNARGKFHIAMNDAATSANVTLADARLTVTSAGNVGIGTTSPTNAKLVVEGSSAGTVGAIMSTDVAGTTSFVRMIGDVGSQNLLNWQTGTALRFATSTQAYGTFAEHARINSNGELLIATTTDAGNYKLQVSGQAFIRNTATSGALYLDSTSLSIYEVKDRHAILISGHSLTGAEIQGPIYVGTNWNTSSDVSAIEVALTNTASGANSNLMKLSDGTNTFRVTKDAGIFTAAPSGGTARKWKFGSAATVSPTSPNRTIQIEVDGVVYYLHAKTTND